MLILVNPFPVAVYTSIMNLKKEASEVFRDMFGNFAPGNRPEADIRMRIRHAVIRKEKTETRRRTDIRVTSHDCELLSFGFYSAYDFFSPAVFFFAGLAELNYREPSFTGCKMTFLVVGKCCYHNTICS